MGVVMFYHLTHSAVEDTLPMLLGKSLQAGWRVAVRGTDPARMQALDLHLWQGEDVGFLPHGLAGGEWDADQPVLLTCAAETPNRAACLIALDGAEIATDEAAGLERVCVIFDGNDPSALAQARGQWKGVTAAGVAAQYWSEETGRWQKKAERPAASEV
jgi:DNA polymerase III subunit chi